MRPVTLCWSAERSPPMAKTGQEVLRCAYPGCENQPRPAEAGAAAEPGHCGQPDPGDRAAAHGADRAPAPSGAGPARWRDGPGRRTGPPGVRGAAISPRWRAAPPARRGCCRGGARDGAGGRCVADRGAGGHAARRRPPGNLATSSYWRRATILSPMSLDRCRARTVVVSSAGARRGRRRPRGDLRAGLEALPGTRANTAGCIRLRVSGSWLSRGPRAGPSALLTTGIGS